MTINELINEYGETHSPHASGHVNHLPMGQMALYKMTDNLDIVKEYSNLYVRKVDMDPLVEPKQMVDSIAGCLGDQEAYTDCFSYIKREIKAHGVEPMVRKVLNHYVLGMSSELFHVTIRLAYAIIGYRNDPVATDEVARSLSYYITAYGKVVRLERTTSSDSFKEEMHRIMMDEHFLNKSTSGFSLGLKLKGIYLDEQFYTLGCVIEGGEEEKARALLEVLVDYYNHSGDFFVLHCITGLHALLVLQNYFDDFSDALDVYTTSVIAHLLTLKGLESLDIEVKWEKVPWNHIIEKGIEDRDVHTIKFVYSCYELHKLFGMEELKKAALIRIGY